MNFELILFWVTFALIIVFIIWNIIEKTGKGGPFDGGSGDGGGE